MAKQKKLPAMQFYTGDWMKDTNLRGVTLAAKGLWIDMLCLMHESDRRGYLQSNGKPITQDQLARMAGCSSEEVSQCLEELENSGVFSRTKNSTIYSRRMKRDEEIRRNSMINGRLGGNPSLKAGVNPPLNPKRGSSSSSSTSVKDIKMPDEIPDSLYRVAEVVLSPMPEGQLRVIMLNHKNTELVEQALNEAGKRGIKGKHAVHYAMKCLEDWAITGGPQKNDNSNQNPGRGPSRPNKGKAKEVDFSSIETGAAL